MRAKQVQRNYFRHSVDENYRNPDAATQRKRKISKYSNSIEVHHYKNVYESTQTPTTITSFASKQRTTRITTESVLETTKPNEKYHVVKSIHNKKYELPRKSNVETPGLQMHIVHGARPSEIILPDQKHSEVPLRLLGGVAEHKLPRTTVYHNANKDYEKKKARQYTATNDQVPNKEAGTNNKGRRAHSSTDKPLTTRSSSRTTQQTKTIENRDEFKWSNINHTKKYAIIQGDQSYNNRGEDAYTNEANAQSEKSIIQTNDNEERVVTNKFGMTTSTSSSNQIMGTILLQDGSIKDSDGSNGSKNYITHLNGTGDQNLSYDEQNSRSLHEHPENSDQRQLPSHTLNISQLQNGNLKHRNHNPNANLIAVQLAENKQYQPHDSFNNVISNENVQLPVPVMNDRHHQHTDSSTVIRQYKQGSTNQKQQSPSISNGQFHSHVVALYNETLAGETLYSNNSTQASNPRILHENVHQHTNEELNNVNKLEIYLSTPDFSKHSYVHNENTPNDDSEVTEKRRFTKQHSISILPSDMEESLVSATIPSKNYTELLNIKENLSRKHLREHTTFGHISRRKPWQLPVVKNNSGTFKMGGHVVLSMTMILLYFQVFY